MKYLKKMLKKCQCSQIFIQESSLAEKHAAYQKRSIVQGRILVWNEQSYFGNGTSLPSQKFRFPGIQFLRKKVQKNFRSKFFHTKDLKIPSRKMSISLQKIKNEQFC